MPVVSDREAAELSALVAALSDDPSAALGRVRLAQTTRLPPSRITELTARHPSYFVSVAGKSLYALNRFGTFRGSKPLILRDIERARAAARAVVAGAFTAIPGALLISLGVMVPSVLSGQADTAAFMFGLLTGAIYLGILAVLFLGRLHF